MSVSRYRLREKLSHWISRLALQKQHTLSRLPSAHHRIHCCNPSYQDEVLCDSDIRKATVVSPCFPCPHGAPLLTVNLAGLGYGQVEPPTSEEAARIENRTLISLLFPALSEDLVKQLEGQGATVMAMDCIPRTLSRGQTYDALSSQVSLVMAVVDPVAHNP